ncbi:MAG: M48 family metalloprotease [Chitinophagaceae bacterium]|nr:M48 family metalloprotease [Chitinophagaceae bacterium]
MQPLFQSAFLQALGFAIANSLWQTALVWLLYSSVSYALPLSSAARHRSAVAAQLISFIWFAVTIRFYYTGLLQHTAGAPSDTPGIQAVISGSQGFNAVLLKYVVRAEQMLPYVSAAYLLLMLILCIRWISGYRQTQQIRKQGIHKIPVEWRLFVKKIAGQLGIRKEIRIFLSETISTPLTIGFWKPVILVPVASINHLTTEQLEAVLLHELAHIKRYDYLVNIILSAVEIALFFNPFTQLLSKSIRKERENSCDDWVLQFRYQASDYAAALLRIASLQATPSFAMAAGSRKNELLVRVKRMIGEKENRFNYRRQLLAFMLVTGVLTSIAWLNPARPAADKKNIPVTKQIVAQQPKLQIPAPKVAAPLPNANPLFNPSWLLSKPLQDEMKKSLDAAQHELQSLDALPAATASVSALVGDAINQASQELAAQSKTLNMDKELGSLEQTRKGMEKLFGDSLHIPRLLRTELNNELDRSLRQLQSEIEKAKTNASEAGQAAYRLKKDQGKFKKDLSQRMISFSAKDFQQLAEQSLKIAGLTLEKMPRQWKRFPVKRSPEQQAGPAEQADEKEELSLPRIPVNEPREQPLVLTPELLIQLKSIQTMIDNISVEGMNPEMQIRFQQKMAWIQKLFARTIKVVPAINRIRVGEDSISIRIQ